MHDISAGGIYGAIEAGGTKFVCAVADESGAILAEKRLPTLDPDATLIEVCSFFHEQFARLGPPRSFGVGSFGPVHLDKSSSQYGRIGNTPKAGWSGTDIVGRLAREFACPVGFDTDVNAAALAEHRWGAARDVDDLVYVTVGTGIGGGIIVRGTPLHGLMHPGNRAHFSAPAPSWISNSGASARSMETASKALPRAPRSWPAAAPNCTACRRRVLNGISRLTIWRSCVLSWW